MVQGGRAARFMSAPAPQVALANGANRSVQCAGASPLGASHRCPCIFSQPRVKLGNLFRAVFSITSIQGMSRMRTLFRIAGCSTTLAALVFSTLTTANAADDWTISGMVLSPNGIISDGAIAISKQIIAAVGPRASIPSSSSAVKVPGIILPGFIDLHDHLTWNVLPRWIPARKFNNRYEWQDTAEYDRAL